MSVVPNERELNSEPVPLTLCIEELWVKKIVYLCIQDILVLTKARTYTHSCKRGDISHFKRSRVLGGKLHGYPHFLREKTTKS